MRLALAFLLPDLAASAATTPRRLVRREHRERVASASAPLEPLDTRAPDDDHAEVAAAEPAADATRATLRWLVGGGRPEERAATRGRVRWVSALQRRQVASQFKQELDASEEKPDAHIKDRREATEQTAKDLEHSVASSEQVEASAAGNHSIARGGLGGVGAFGRPMTQGGMTCNPSMERQKYERCLVAKYVRFDCDLKTCEESCCCTLPTYLRRLQELWVFSKEAFWAVATPFIVALAVSNGVDPDDTSHEGSAHGELLSDKISRHVEEFGIAIPLVCGLLSGLYMGIKRAVKQKRKIRMPRPEEPTLEETLAADLEDDETNEAKMERDIKGIKYSKSKLAQLIGQGLVDDHELEKLGEVESYIVAKVCGMTTWNKFIVTLLSFGLYNVLMDDPVKVSLTILGDTGRLLVVVRKPSLDVKQANRLFIRTGAMIWFAYLFAMTAQIIREERGGPSVGSSAPAVAVGTFVALWLFMLVNIKAGFRTWGYADERNYYDSRNACVGQYIRHGDRGLLPCLCPTIRRGGMRLFFGPYPTKGVFQFMTKGHACSQNLIPMLTLPKTADKGVPKSGNPQSVKSESEEAGFLRLVYQLVSVIFMIFGVACFGVRAYNLTFNMANCPISSQIHACVGTNASDSNCEVARRPWFTTLMFENSTLTGDQRQRFLYGPPLDSELLGYFAGAESADELKRRVLFYAEKACAEQRVSYFDAPREWKEGIKSETFQNNNAGTFFSVMYMKGLHDTGITWDPGTLTCKNCRTTVLALYLTNLENLWELVEMVIVIVLAYLNILLFRAMGGTLENVAMIDMPFETCPSSKDDVDVESIEGDCFQLMGNCFMYRYQHTGTPVHLRNLEKKLLSYERDGKIDTASLADPWKFDHKSTSWKEYSINEMAGRGRRAMVVSKTCLSIMAEEAVVAAWAESPNLSTNQLRMVILSLCVFVLFPMYRAIVTRMPICMAETVILIAMWVNAIEFFIIRRRPQAGFVLTTRRVYQITRLPAAVDLFGKTEPFIAMDILVHGCQMFMSSLIMEPRIPVARKLYLKIMGLPQFKRGAVLCVGDYGIFYISRSMGETTDLCRNMSVISRSQPNRYLKDGLRHKLDTQEEEYIKQHGLEESRTHLTDPPCSWCCCPHTPAPPLNSRQKNRNVLERYSDLKKGETECYERKLATRPATCLEFFCGKPCEFSCCCCCQLDEISNHLSVSNHRMVVEHMATQRYCRWCSCGRRYPNIRATYLVHIRAGAYRVDSPITPVGLTSLRKDLEIKRLVVGTKNFFAGLMLHQRPYLIMQKDDTAIEQPWLSSIFAIYDYINDSVEVAELPDDSDKSDASSSESSSEDLSDEAAGPSMTSKS